MFKENLKEVFMACHINHDHSLPSVSLEAVLASLARVRRHVVLQGMKKALCIS
jgi:hypothetical protein